jgi:thiol-disulfide isomerase/thioredoxin
VLEEGTSKLLKNKQVIGVYFSASWCGPCRQFTPELIKFYNQMKKNNKNFEIVWISRDRSPQEFLEYFSQMPWLSVTWENFQEVGRHTASLYGMKGIPHLAILDGEDLSVITIEGRTKVLQDKYGLEFPWRPRNLMNFVPKPVKRYISTHMKIFSKFLIQTLRGITAELAPVSIVRTARTTLCCSCRITMFDGKCNLQLNLSCGLYICIIKNIIDIIFI